MAKYVFVTGGVTSSLGKGVTAAPIGRILKARGLGCDLGHYERFIDANLSQLSSVTTGRIYQAVIATASR